MKPTPTAPLAPFAWVAILASLSTALLAQEAAPTTSVPAAPPVSTAPTTTTEPAVSLVPGLINTDGAGLVSQSADLPLFGGGVFDTDALKLWNQLGPVRLSTSLSYSHIWQEGGANPTGSVQNTELDEVVPSLSLHYLDYFSFNYEPSWVFYSNRAFSDYVRHRFSMETSAKVGRLRTSGHLSYERNQREDLETGLQSLRESWRARGIASMPIARGFSFDVEGGVRARATPSVRLVRSWELSTYLRYTPLRSTSIRAGYTYGYSAVSPGTDSSSDEFSVQMRYNPGRKLSLSGKVGYETRHLESSSGRSSDNVKSSFEATYRLGQKTTVSASAQRSVDSSLNQNRERDRQGWQAAVSYLLPYRMVASYSYRDVNVYYFLFGSAADRVDHTKSQHLSLQVPITRRLVGSGFASWTKNDSSRSTFSRDSSQYGISLRYSF